MNVERDAAAAIKNIFAYPHSLQYRKIKQHAQIKCIVENMELRSNDDVASKDAPRL